MASFNASQNINVYEIFACLLFFFFNTILYLCPHIN